MEHVNVFVNLIDLVSPNSHLLCTFVRLILVLKHVSIHEYLISEVELGIDFGCTVSRLSHLCSVDTEEERLRQILQPCCLVARLVLTFNFHLKG